MRTEVPGAGDAAPADPLSARRLWPVLAAAVAAAAMYHLFAIWRSSFVIEGLRYFCLMDDAMVSMCFAKNVVAGHGLVWFPGQEPVEGFSNPLWVLLMTLPHLAGLGRHLASLPVQLLGSGLLLATGLLAAAPARRFFSAWPVFTTVAVFLFVSLNMPLMEWSLGGLETSGTTFLVALGCWLIFTGRHTPVRMAALYFAGFSLRMDFAIYSFAMAVALCLAERERAAVHMGALAVGCLGAFAAQLAWRLPYYGEWLPNTYQLKAGGAPTVFRATKGVLMLAYVVHAFGPLTFIAAALGLAALPRAMRALPVLLIAIACLYHVHVGGDAWEEMVLVNRFLSPVLPVFLMLVVGGVARLVGWLGGMLNGRGRAALWLPGLLAACVLCLVHARVSLGQLNLLESLWRTAQVNPYMPRRVASGFALENHDNVRAALLMRDLLEPGARVAAYHAGVPVYFGGEFIFTDGFGKNDKHIARIPGELPGSIGRLYSFRPGHTKFDADYSLQQFGADASHRSFYDTSFRPIAEAHFIRLDVPDTATDVYLRRASEKVRWDRAEVLLAAGE